MEEARLLGVLRCKTGNLGTVDTIVSGNQDLTWGISLTILVVELNDIHSCTVGDNHVENNRFPFSLGHRDSLCPLVVGTWVANLATSWATSILDSVSSTHGTRDSLGRHLNENGALEPFLDRGRVSSEPFGLFFDPKRSESTSSDLFEGPLVSMGVVPVHTCHVVVNNLPEVNTAHTSRDKTGDIIRVSISSNVDSVGVQVSVRFRSVDEVDLVNLSWL
jgi:hypothetical protein